MAIWGVAFGLVGCSQLTKRRHLGRARDKQGQGQEGGVGVIDEGAPQGEADIQRALTAWLIAPCNGPDWRHLNSGEALSGKQTPCPLTQPSAMPETSVLIVLCRPCPLGTKSLVDWAGYVRLGLWKSLVPSSTHSNNLPPGSGVSPTLPTPGWLQAWAAVRHQ